jgi:ribosome-associated toxin RatA of RatAB toxin-antitoxin module
MRDGVIPSKGATMNRGLALALAILGLVAARPLPSAGQARTAPPGTPAPQAIAPVDPAEIALLRPLIDRGAVIVPRRVDQNAASRCTIYVRVRAPLATVHRVIATPEEYPRFVPGVAGVEVLGRRGPRAAFRFHATAALFDVTADATLHAVGDRRIDITIPASVVGPSGSRWELFPDGADATLVALTMWTDPSQAMPLIRQYVGTSGYASSSANITVETVLALGVKRRAEILAGAALPVRPARAVSAQPTFVPPPPGPWLALAARDNVVAVTLDPEGALQQITVIGHTNAPASIVVHRLLDVEAYGVFWGWMRDNTILARSPSAERVVRDWGVLAMHETASVRFRTSLGAPFSAGEGELLSRVEPGGATAWIEGISGAFAGERHRWDFVQAPQGGTYVLYTAGSMAAHAGFFHRLIMERDVWAVTGMSAYWATVMLRYGLWALG